MTFDTTTLLVAGALLLVAFWLLGRLKKLGGCLLNALLAGAALLLIYGLYTGRFVLPF